MESEDPTSREALISTIVKPATEEGLKGDPRLISTVSNAAGSHKETASTSQIPSAVSSDVSIWADRTLDIDTPRPGSTKQARNGAIETYNEPGNVNKGKGRETSAWPDLEKPEMADSEQSHFIGQDFPVSSASAVTTPPIHSRHSATSESIPPDTTISSPRRRNLVVVLDGTANQFGLYNSNCVELYSHLEKTDLEKTHYNSGIGTYINSKTHGRFSAAKQKLLNGWDMAVAFRLKRIFLFGFSRGAYEVRALAAMIHKVGLIHTGTEEQIEFAYDLYADSSERGMSLAAVFKTTFARDIGKAQVIGVWDTVSSVGIVRSKTLPGVSDTEHVNQIRHAVALDERRVQFQPELYYSPAGKGIETPFPHVKEVWFPGCHSDIGGGNRENSQLLLGDVPLIWLEWEAMQNGLQFNAATPISYKAFSLYTQRITESMNWKWRLLELRHHGRGRIMPPVHRVHIPIKFKVFPRQVKHTSLWETYKPAASSVRWPGWNTLADLDSLSEQERHQDILEADFEDYRPRVLRSLIEWAGRSSHHTTFREASAMRLMYVAESLSGPWNLIRQRGMIELMLTLATQWDPNSRMGTAILLALWGLIDPITPYRGYEWVIWRIMSTQNLQVLSNWICHNEPRNQWAGIVTLGKLLDVYFDRQRKEELTNEVLDVIGPAIRRLADLVKSKNATVAEVSLILAGSLADCGPARQVLRQSRFLQASSP